MAAIILLIASAAHAANFCALFGSAQVVASGLTLPASGSCAAFNGFYSGSARLLAGDVCRSSNGTTFLFNLFTQYMGTTDSLAGTWVASSGKGSGQECFTSPCLSFNVTVKKCPATLTIPANLSSFESEAPPPSQTMGDPDSP